MRGLWPHWVPGWETRTSEIYQLPSLLLQVPGGGGMGWVGVKVVGFIHSLRFSSLCQIDQPHSFLL